MPAPKLPIAKAVPFVIQALAVFGGVSGGVWLKSTLAADGGEEASHKGDHKAPDKADKHGDKSKDQHAAKDKKESGKKAAKDSHGGGHGGGHGAESAKSGGDTGFMKFSRQFVVPVISPSGVRSLVVMDINIEVPPGMEETVYTREPKLRDSMLAVMLNLSNRGAFDQNLLHERNLEIIRSELLGAARTVIGDDAQNVLILNITRQDV